MIVFISFLSIPFHSMVRCCLFSLFVSYSVILLHILFLLLRPLRLFVTISFSTFSFTIYHNVKLKLYVQCSIWCAYCYDIVVVLVVMMILLYCIAIAIAHVVVCALDPSVYSSDIHRIHSFSQ